MATLAQDRGYQGAADVAGFGTEIPNPGFSFPPIFTAGSTLELAELEAARGDFTKADAQLVKADSYAADRLSGDDRATYDGWRATAGSFVDSLRPQEPQLQEDAVAKDGALVNENLAFDQSPEADTQKQDNARVADLMTAQKEGASKAELDARYLGLPPVLAKSYGVSQDVGKQLASAAKEITSTKGLIVLAALALLVVIAKARLL